jgi:hypothetical protein
MLESTLARAYTKHKHTHTYIPGVLGRAVSYGDPSMVRNTEVILGLAQLGLQTVHTGDSQHELGGVRPHLRWEKGGVGEERGVKPRSL